jgi:hypothetical protein
MIMTDANEVRRRDKAITDVNRFFCVILISAAFGSAAATPETATYHNQDYGFTIEIPCDWVHLPEDTVYEEGVAYPTWKFEPKDTSFPALNVLVSDYKAFGIAGQITERGIQAAINSARLMGAKDSEVEVITSSYDPDHKIYTQVVDFQIQGGCEKNCVNGHGIVKLSDRKGILWTGRHRNN